MSERTPSSGYVPHKEWRDRTGIYLIGLDGPEQIKPRYGRKSSDGVEKRVTLHSNPIHRDHKYFVQYSDLRENNRRLVKMGEVVVSGNSDEEMLQYALVELLGTDEEER